MTPPILNSRPSGARGTSRARPLAARFSPEVYRAGLIAIGEPMAPKTPEPAPALLPGALYPRRTIIAILRISEKTFRDLIRNHGLRRLPFKSKTHFYLGAHVIAAMQRSKPSREKRKNDR